VLGLVAFWILRAAERSLASSWGLELFLPGQIATAIGMHGALTGMLGLMLFMYLWLAMFACIGGTIYEQREQLGIDVAESPELAAARAHAEVERQRDKIMDQLFWETRSGTISNAAETIRKLLADAPRPLDECRWLYARAASMENQRLANHLAQLTLPRLIDARASGEALTMLRQRLAAKTDFKPKTSTEVLQLAQLARDAGDRPMARQLLADFDRHFPNDALAVAVHRMEVELER
jgi:hypothetical protein